MLDFYLEDILIDGENARDYRDRESQASHDNPSIKQLAPFFIYALKAPASKTNEERWKVDLTNA